MEIVQMVIYSVLFFGALFGVPIGHAINLLFKEEMINSRYKKPEEYKDMAIIQVANLLFLVMVYLGFWWFLRDAGSGSFNGIMMLPFLIIYISVMVIHQKKIGRLALNNEKRRD